MVVITGGSEGIGYALSEEILSEAGTNLNANLWEYLIPTAPQIPDLTVDLVEVPSGSARIAPGVDRYFLTSCPRTSPPL